MGENKEIKNGFNGVTLSNLEDLHLDIYKIKGLISTIRRTFDYIFSIDEDLDGITSILHSAIIDIEDKLNKLIKSSTGTKED